MMKIVLSGYGKMGREIFSILEKRDNVTLYTTEKVDSFDPAIAKESICIDFTTPEAFRNNYNCIAGNFKAAVIGTTGWGDIKEDVLESFRKSGNTMIYASNFSIGVNVLFELAGRTSAMLSALGDFDPYITEFHHKFKLDAPSGTAATLRSIVEKEYGRCVQIQSVRAGAIPGIHNLGFESSSERVVLSHEAFSRSVFANGAVTAALWTEEVKGVHDFRDLLKERFIKILNNERD